MIGYEQQLPEYSILGAMHMPRTPLGPPAPVRNLWQVLQAAQNRVAFWRIQVEKRITVRTPYHQQKLMWGTLLKYERELDEVVQRYPYI